MYHIVINPASRSGKGLKLWEEKIAPILDREQVEYTPYFSKKPGDVSSIVKGLCETEPEPVNIVILGGDGTVDEAIQGLINGKKVVLGYIPTGSSNDLARDLKIPSDPEAAVKSILHTGKPVAMDIGEVIYDDDKSNHYFADSCGVGFDAAVCEEAARSKMKGILNKIGLGKLIYLVIALKQICGAKRVTCKLTLDDEKEINVDHFLFVASMVHRYEGGGFMFAPDATGTDGKLHLCMAADISKPGVLRALPTAFKGKHFRFKGIYGYAAQKVHIETSLPLWVHTDGEVERQSDSFTVICKSKAVDIILP